MAKDCVTSLVAAARRGDGSAFGALAARFRRTMLVVAGREGCGRDCAEDAVQDALLVAHRALGNLDDPARFGPWFAAIVRHRARRLARERGRHAALPGADLPAPPAPSSSAEEAIRALPEGIRETAFLYYLERWSVGEIAALLERPVSTVKWQLHASRSLLRRRLGHPENL